MARGTNAYQNSVPLPDTRPPPPPPHTHSAVQCADISGAGGGSTRTHSDEGGKVSSPRLHLETRGRRKQEAIVSSGTDIPEAIPSAEVHARCATLCLHGILMLDQQQPPTYASPFPACLVTLGPTSHEELCSTQSGVGRCLWVVPWLMTLGPILLPWRVSASLLTSMIVHSFLRPQKSFQQIAGPA